jgi:hypothetical protein
LSRRLEQSVKAFSPRAAREQAQQETAVQAFDFHWVTSAEGWIALGTLTVLEIVLGIDNIVFISILAASCGPRNARAHGSGPRTGDVHEARAAAVDHLGHGLDGAVVLDLGKDISGRDFILIVGGLFLIAKSTHEIHEKLEGEEGHAGGKVAATFAASSSRSSSSTSCSRSIR